VDKKTLPGFSTLAGGRGIEAAARARLQGFAALEDQQYDATSRIGLEV
jgi:hypothetical protein